MFARDGYSVIGYTFLICLILAGTGYYFGGVVFYILGSLSVLMLAFTLYFFRDPERTTPEGDHLMISPADGKVIEIKPVFEDKYLKSEATQISIFLSPLDVHVNRNPVSGLVEYARYVPGEYLVAWHEKASELNERSEFGVKHASGTKIFFRQITGYVARRIVFHINEGDHIKAGERFGMMKFGSRMDIVVPASVKLFIKPGDVTVGGESVIGEIGTP